MLERVNVPPFKSLGESFEAVASACNRFSSLAISKMLFPSQFFIFGTSKPDGVSMATPIL